MDDAHLSEFEVVAHRAMQARQEYWDERDARIARGDKSHYMFDDIRDQAYQFAEDYNVSYTAVLDAMLLVDYGR